MQDTLESAVKKINRHLENSALFYLSNDPERALGLEKLLPSLHIVYIDSSQYGPYLDATDVKSMCLADLGGDSEYRSSAKLIRSPEFVEYFNKHKKAKNYIQTFKISSQFSFQVSKLGCAAVNTSAALNRRFEDKISQYENICDIGISLPRTVIIELGELAYADLVNELGIKFVVQFDRGHTGSGTVFIENETQFVELQKQFPMRHVRISQFVEGRAYTLNACVGRDGIYMGGLSAQITGISELTPNAGGTIGNDWAYRKDLVSGVDAIREDVIKIGNKMRASGYKGLFGVDLVVRPDGTHAVIEINARQPASIPMYTRMQLSSGQVPLALIHLLEFLDLQYEIDVERYNEFNLKPSEFAQIFIRPETDMLLQREMEMGVYKLVHGEMQFIRNGYSIEQIEGNEFIVLTQKAGRIVKRNAELARIQMKQGVLDENGELKRWVINTLLAIKEYQK
jgi:glutathione synthase/RimK-type ligase-like ATP-grasp enzyme